MITSQPESVELRDRAGGCGAPRSGGPSRRRPAHRARRPVSPRPAVCRGLGRGRRRAVHGRTAVRPGRPLRLLMHHRRPASVEAEFGAHLEEVVPGVAATARIHLSDLRQDVVELLRDPLATGAARTGRRPRRRWRPPGRSGPGPERPNCGGAEQAAGLDVAAAGFALRQADGDVDAGGRDAARADGGNERCEVGDDHHLSVVAAFGLPAGTGLAPSPAPTPPGSRRGRRRAGEQAAASGQPGHVHLVLRRQRDPPPDQFVGLRLGQGRRPAVEQRVAPPATGHVQTSRARSGSPSRPWSTE